ncbi:hypothetical protein [Kytococcus sedentarius]|uniref:hypothetical protein n=1 Tax=Kytococcus sedentarius TaxID=1276 RepID=UPI0035BC8D53
MNLIGKIFTLLGVLGLVAAVALGVSSDRWGTATAEAVRGGDRVGQSITRELEADRTYLLTVDLDAAYATCHGKGPDGTAIATFATEEDYELVDGVMELAGAVHPTLSGEHTFTCSSPDVRLTEAVHPWGTSLPSLGVIVSLLLGVGSLVLLVVGVVLWRRGSSRGPAPRSALR